MARSSERIRKKGKRSGMDEKRERKEKGGKVGDNNRSLVGGEERVRGSPEHVTIIPSPGGVYVYTCRIGTGGVVCAAKRNT